MQNPAAVWTAIAPLVGHRYTDFAVGEAELPKTLMTTDPQNRSGTCRPAWLAAALAHVLVALTLAACGEDAAKAESAGAGATQDVAGADLSVGEGDVAAATSDADAGAGADVAAAADADGAVDTPDGGGDGTVSCPGGPFCPCTKDNECDAGICLETADGKQCTKNCGGDSSCPSGWDCKLYGTVDPVSVCLPKHMALCAPCSKHTDCQVAADKDAWCLDYGEDGKFCGAGCAKDQDCPLGYGCVDQKDGGTTNKQCRLLDPKAVCSCSSWAKKSGLKTACTQTNTYGACGGTRSCGSDGLSACSGPVAKAEVCNAEDDNCDGKVDNLAPDAVCYKVAYASSGSGKACKEDGDCPQGEGCTVGICKELLGKCKGKPTCTSGGQEVCADALTPKKEICNNEDDDCDGLTDEDFSAVDLAGGGTVAVGQPCGTGACSGGTVQCQTIVTAVCTTSSAAKPELCNAIDDDCNGATDDATCDDGSACTTDSCDGKAGKCAHDPAINCDDGQVCTIDSCDKKTGACVIAPNLGGSCSDDNPCTVGDACGSDDKGAAICQPGAAALDCDDKNPCTDDSCVAKVGCANLANAETATCYDGPPGSIEVGTCKAGKKLCQNGTFGPCIGQVTPSGVEACDGLDDDCDSFTDEICKANALEVGFAAAAGPAQVADQAAWLELGGESLSIGPANAPGAGNSMWTGLMRWLASWL